MHQYWFVWWMCVLFLGLVNIFKPTVTASHSQRRKVQLRRQWDGTEDNSPITPSLLHKTHSDHVECIDHSYWREITVHQIIIITWYFLPPIFFVKVLRRYWQLPSLCWSCCDCLSEDQREVFKFDNALSTRPANTSSNLLLLSKPTWKLEQKLTFF